MKKDEYPVKMNLGCFIPLLIYAIIGFFSIFGKYL